MEAVNGPDVLVPRQTLQALLDLAVHSLDFGSGFWDQEDVDVAREVATLLGDVCPNACTPTDMLSKYPTCAGVEAQTARYRAGGWTEEQLRKYGPHGHDDHPWP